MAPQLDVSKHSMHKALDVFHGHRPWWKATKSSHVIFIKEANIGQRELDQLRYNLSTDSFHSVDLLNCKGDADAYLRTCLSHGISTVTIHDRSQPSNFGHKAIAAIGRALLEEGDKIKLQRLSLRINILNEDLEHSPSVRHAWETFLAGLRHAPRTLRQVSFCPHDPWVPKLDAVYVEAFTHALSGHKNLKSLDIFQCQVSPTSYRHIMSLNELSSLAIQDSTQDHRSLIEFLHHLPHMPCLRTLQLPKGRPRAVRTALLRSLRDSPTRMGNSSLNKIYLGMETFSLDAEVQFYLQLNLTRCREPLEDVTASDWLGLIKDLDQDFADDGPLHTSMLYYLVRRSAPLLG